MARSSAEWDWGSWVVGDMADVIRRAADILGGTFEVVRACAAPPEQVGDAPRALIVVTDQHTCFRLRTLLREGELLPRFVGQSSGGRWRAEVDGIDLTVAVDQEGLW